jgi:hypothetical protein
MEGQCISMCFAASSSSEWETRVFRGAKILEGKYNCAIGRGSYVAARDLVHWTPWNRDWRSMSSVWMRGELCGQPIYLLDMTYKGFDP